MLRRVDLAPLFRRKEGMDPPDEIVLTEVTRSIPPNEEAVATHGGSQDGLTAPIANTGQETMEIGGAVVTAEEVEEVARVIVGEAVIGGSPEVAIGVMAAMVLTDAEVGQPLRRSEEIRESVRNATEGQSCNLSRLRMRAPKES